MSKNTNAHYCGIGGQAVLEGVMMKNEDKYAVAVRKPDGQVAVEVDSFESTGGKTVLKIPFIRGIFQFIDSLRLGMKVLTFSSSFYEEEEEEGAVEKFLDRITGGKGEKILTVILEIASVLLAIGLFIVLPYMVSSHFDGYIRNHSILMLIEGGIRILIFLLYSVGIGLMKDVRRLYQYHGAEHKCINCIERGRELTPENVMKSSRLHKRCGTSFIFFVLIVSVVIFFFIHVDNIFLRICLRLLLLPVVAGISYELIRLAGRHDNFLVKVLSAPGFLFQKLTTKEPDESMVEVAIASVEAVFDWRLYLQETFGYEVDEEEQV